MVKKLSDEAQRIQDAGYIQGREAAAIVGVELGGGFRKQMEAAGVGILYRRINDERSHYWYYKPDVERYAARRAAAMAAAAEEEERQILQSNPRTRNDEAEPVEESQGMQEPARLVFGAADVDKIAGRVEQLRREVVNWGGVCAALETEGKQSAAILRGGMERIAKEARDAMNRLTEGLLTLSRRVSYLERTAEDSPSLAALAERVATLEALEADGDGSSDEVFQMDLPLPEPAAVG